MMIGLVILLLGVRVPVKKALVSANSPLSRGVDEEGRRIR